MRTSELTSLALDWAVAKCEGLMQGQIAIDGVAHGFYKPSTEWAQGGPIIEREGINIERGNSSGRWEAWTPAPERRSGEAVAQGLTPLIAAMRCYVASKLGDEIQIPEELTVEKGESDGMECSN